MRATGRVMAARAVISVALALVAASCLYPLFFMFTTSLRSGTEYLRDPLALPRTWFDFTNYAAMMVQFDLPRLFANSLGYIAAAWVISTAVSLPAAYAFAKLRFPLRRMLFTMFVSSLAVPAVTFVIPDYVLFARFSLIDTPMAVILLWASTSVPGTVYLLAAFMRGLPSSVIEAAHVDGAGYFRSMASVILPMTRPAVVTITIFNVTAWWNDLLTPLIFLQSQEKATMTLGVANIVQRYSTDTPLFVTGLLLAALPPILIYLVAQRYIRRGLVMGAVK